MLTTIDANLTSANFPTTLAGMTRICSGGGGGNMNRTANPNTGVSGTGGTGGGNGGNDYDDGLSGILKSAATSATSYGSGGGGGGWSGTSNDDSGAGFTGVVIVRQAV